MRIEPTAEQFREIGARRRLVAVHTEVLADSETALSAYRKLAAGRRGAFLLESAEAGAWNRYSYIGCDPIATLTVVDGEAHWLGTPPAGLPTSGDPLEAVRETLRILAADDQPGMPPMLSSLVGYMGWDVIRRIERLGPGAQREREIPELSLSIPGDVAVLDHYRGTITLVANVVNVDGSPERIDEARAAGVERVRGMLCRLLEPAPADLVVPDLTAQPEPRMRTEHADYLAAVERAKEHIVDGDVFQVVIGQRFDLDVEAPPLDVYRMLRTLNPSPYMYLLDIPTPDGSPLTIVGSSPESLVKVDAGTVVTHPIAGSRPRGRDALEDDVHAKDLLADPKERAEHLMLVDLARNDLAKVCAPGTVDVSDFMSLVRYSHIMHIVSTVRGRLREGRDAVDVVRATFPAGTLSGAPKPRALEIIDDLETVSRGLYGGVVGYLSFSGDLDLAIAIRTGTMTADGLSVSAGGGIVADSVPQLEYEESCNKAAAVLRAAAAASTLRRADLDEEA